MPTAIPGADQLAGEADPEELANIEAHRSLWESMKPTETWRFVQALPTAQRTVVVLRFYEDLGRTECVVHRLDDTGFGQLGYYGSPIRTPNAPPTDVRASMDLERAASDGG